MTAPQQDPDDVSQETPPDPNAAARDAQAPAGSPKRIGRYAVVRKLGSGGFATVWLAHDEVLDADVAIKVLAEHWVDDEDVRDRFIAEGRFLRRVDSPHVVGVHDIGETDEGRPYLVLTYADRGTLDQRLAGGPMPADEAIPVLQQIATGLRALHNRDLLHRDIKPANVLFRSTPEGERAMVGDLGLGKSLDAVSRLTLPGGTPAYVAPEQVRGDQLDPRADQYALAAVAYAMLSGRSPHGAKTLAAVLAITEPPPPLRTLRPEIPAVVEAAVQKGLALDRDERWPDVTAFAEGLTAGQVIEIPRSARLGAAAPATPRETPEPAQTTQTAPAIEPTPPRRRTRAAVAIGLAAALLGAGGAYAGVRIGTDRQWIKVTDSRKQLTVEVPRSWADEIAGAGWTPPGAKTTEPGLLLSSDNARWSDTASEVRGVFAGALGVSSLPAKIPAPQGCIDAATQPSTDKVSAVFSCGDLVTHERIVLLGGQAVRIQVRSHPNEDDQVRRILNSLTFEPTG